MPYFKTTSNYIHIFIYIYISNEFIYSICSYNFKNYYPFFKHLAIMVDFKRQPKIILQKPKATALWKTTMCSVFGSDSPPYYLIWPINPQIYLSEQGLGEWRSSSTAVQLFLDVFVQSQIYPQVYFFGAIEVLWKCRWSAVEVPLMCRWSANSQQSQPQTFPLHRALAPLDYFSGISWYASINSMIIATVRFCHRPWGCVEGSKHKKYQNPRYTFSHKNP